MAASSDVKSYALVTSAYWAFTLTDGALRMLVLLHFHGLGFDPITIAFLFLLYEAAGIVTNLVGGWIGARFGLKITLFAGLALQIAALSMLSALDPAWTLAVSVAFVMAAQALSGIAKDLTKMSSKSAVKLVVQGGGENRLFKWVALLTGSKNALKGLGFFLGGALLAGLGFAAALWVMAGALAVVLVLSVLFLKGDLGKAKSKGKIGALFSNNAAINRLSAARMFLFASRDVWFVVGVPLFLTEIMGWGFTETGGFMAAWVIAYGFVQAAAPKFVGGRDVARSAQVWAFILALLPLAIAAALQAGFDPVWPVLGGLALFGVAFAINSSVHSYLILAYGDAERITLDVGFYYMANAAGRLGGTLASGLAYQLGGLEMCLWISGGLIVISGLLALTLPKVGSGPQAVSAEGSGI